MSSWYRFINTYTLWWHELLLLVLIEEFLPNRLLTFICVIDETCLLIFPQIGKYNSWIFKWRHINFLENQQYLWEKKEVQTSFLILRNTLFPLIQTQTYWKIKWYQITSSSYYLKHHPLPSLISCSLLYSLNLTITWEVQDIQYIVDLMKISIILMYSIIWWSYTTWHQCQPSVDWYSVCIFMFIQIIFVVCIHCNRTSKCQWLLKLLLLLYICLLLLHDYIYCVDLLLLVVVGCRWLFCYSLL